MRGVKTSFVNQYSLAKTGQVATRHKAVSGFQEDSVDWTALEKEVTLSHWSFPAPLQEVAAPSGLSLHLLRQELPNSCPNKASSLNPRLLANLALQVDLRKHKGRCMCIKELVLVFVFVGFFFN